VFFEMFSEIPTLRVGWNRGHLWAVQSVITTVMAVDEEKFLKIRDAEEMAKQILKESTEFFSELDSLGLRFPDKAFKDLVLSGLPFYVRDEIQQILSYVRSHDSLRFARPRSENISRALAEDQDFADYIDWCSDAYRRAQADKMSR